MSQCAIKQPFYPQNLDVIRMTVEIIQKGSGFQTLSTASPDILKIGVNMFFVFFFHLFVFK